MTARTAAFAPDPAMAAHYARALPYLWHAHRGDEADLAADGRGTGGA